jgi:hypothetical protein
MKAVFLVFLVVIMGCQATAPEYIGFLCETGTEEERAACFWDYGREMKTASACEGIDFSLGKDACYYGVAWEEPDAALCAKIMDAKYKDLCFYIVAIDGNGELCENIAGPDRDICFMDTAVENDEPDLCESIESEDYKMTCYMDIALNTGDLSLCDKVSDEEFRAYCLEGNTIS